MSHFIYVYLFSLFGFVGVSIPQDVVDFQVDENCYAVIIYLNGVDVTEAKKAALIRAAEITIQVGARYFVILSEIETQGMQGDTNLAPPGNLYQQLIIEKDFDRDQLRYRSLPDTALLPAIRLVFKTYAQKPNKKFIDACKIVRCN